MKYMMALAVCLLSALTLNAQTNVWKGRWAGGKDVLYTVDGQHVYKGRYASGKDILFTFTDQYICKGRYCNSGSTIFTYDKNHFYKGRWASGDAIIYTYDDRHIYHGRYNSSDSIVFTYDKDHLYEGKYNSSGKAVMSFNAAVHPALLTLMAIDHLGIDSTVPKKSTVKSAPFGKASGTLEVGSLVGAKVDHKAHSFAVILSIAGDAYTVKDYLWKNEYTVTKGDLLPVSPEGTAFKSGDKVLAVWPDDGRFYDGVLSKTDAKGAYVQWEDGSKESYVTFEKMIRK